MIVISDSQFERLKDASDAGFAERLVAFLVKSYPEAAESPADNLKEVARGQVARARSFGLSTERELAVYFLTAWLLGETFPETFPAARAVLEDRGRAAADKSDWLERWTVQMLRTLKRRA